MTTTPAAPAAELEPAAWMYGAEREEPFASFKRWPAGVVSMQCWTETALYTADQLQALIEERDRLRDEVKRLREASVVSRRPSAPNWKTHTCEYDGDACQRHNLHCSWPKCAIPRAALAGEKQ